MSRLHTLILFLTVFWIVATGLTVGRGERGGLGTGPRPTAHGRTCRFSNLRHNRTLSCPPTLEQATLGTIVTSYMHTPSKRPAHAYMERMKEFFKLEAAIVAFIDMPYVDYVETLVRYPQRTLVVPITFSQFRTMRCGLKVWQRQHALDSGERHHHSPTLYAVWAEKTTMLARAARSNCFRSRFFVWLDIGYFSETPAPTVPLPSPTFARSMPPGRMLLLAVDADNVLTARSMVGTDGRMTRGLGQGSEWATVNIGGGGFVGDADAVRMWDAAYIDMLDRYIEAGWFAGKDQNLFTSVCAEQPALCALHPAHGDWFMLPRLLEGTVAIQTM